jgi:hypothetical protein
MSEYGIGDIVDFLRKSLGGVAEIDGCGDEDCVVSIISNLTGCRPRVKINAGNHVVIPDLHCGGFTVEVEFGRSPHEGLQQVINYRALLGLRSVLFHITRGDYSRYREFYARTRDLLCNKGIYLTVLSTLNGCALAVTESGVLCLCGGRGGENEALPTHGLCTEENGTK